MLITRAWSLCLGVISLLAVWVFPLPWIDAPPFCKHMVMHMAVVALAAPLLCWGFVEGKGDPVRYRPRYCSAIVASMVELVGVWLWHAPRLHHAARHHAGALVAEQVTFLVAGVYLWVSALGGSAEQRRQRSVAGVAGLLLTSMHMTLLGALIALTPRLLYAPHGSSELLSPLQDQQLGGAIMLFSGAAAYLFGGVWLAKDAWLRPRVGEPQ